MVTSGWLFGKYGRKHMAQMSVKWAPSEREKKYGQQGETEYDGMTARGLYV